MSLPRLLLVDDDEDLVEMMREYLGPEGFLVDAAHNAQMFLAADPARADLIVLDVMLPGRSGFDLLRDFRKSSNVPVIMLTAKDSDVDRVVGLEIGADDYVSKPFNPRELVARVRAVLRRTASGGAVAEGAAAAPRLTVGDVELLPASRQAWCRGRLLELTTAEFNLLETFLRKVGQVVGRDALSQAAFGRQTGHMVDRNVDGLVSKLRRKLDAEAGAERIKTVRNAGYIYAQPTGGEG
ncbi:transcriptional regulatory protein CpxR [mine drainage metagenome]|uniref:Transcriptional regulatory protein CpxR n=1 Tax=mine drainage metagenome TaxID=410659 RepID=A0A1J5RG57_9ZZZZ